MIVFVVSVLLLPAVQAKVEVAEGPSGSQGAPSEGAQERPEDPDSDGREPPTEQGPAARGAPVSGDSGSATGAPPENGPDPSGTTPPGNESGPSGNAPPMEGGSPEGTPTPTDEDARPPQEDVPSETVTTDPGGEAVQEAVPRQDDLPDPTSILGALTPTSSPGPKVVCDCDTATVDDGTAAPSRPDSAPDWIPGAAGLTLAALVGFAVWRVILPSLAALKAVHLGYRIEREDLLTHPARRRMLEHLNEHPGATAADLARAADVTYARATYHIAMLTREQAIRVQRVDNKKRYFPFAAPKQDLDSLRVQDLMRPQTLSGRIVESLRRAPGLTGSRLARALGVSPGHAHYHLTRLIGNGLIEPHRRGREVRYYVAGPKAAASAGSAQPVAA